MRRKSKKLMWKVFSFPRKEAPAKLVQTRAWLPKRFALKRRQVSCMRMIVKMVEGISGISKMPPFTGSRL